MFQGEFKPKIVKKKPIKFWLQFEKNEGRPEGPGFDSRRRLMMMS